MKFITTDNEEFDVPVEIAKEIGVYKGEKGKVSSANNRDNSWRGL